MTDAPFAAGAALRASSLAGLLLHILLLMASTTAAYMTISDNFLRLVPDAGADMDIHTGALLAPLLIPRVPGTAGIRAAQDHFVTFFQAQLPKWEVEWQNSSARTPLSGEREVPFSNLIFRREPPWTKTGQANMLTLVAHYDSKISPEGFIGAIDSAVPCAVLMHVARSIDQYLTQMHDEMVELGELGGTPAMDMGVQILFLDGEEAFVKWTATDSLYGSRALAANWETAPTMVQANFPNRLNQISMFVLLDLLGSADPKVPSYFQTTHWAYQGMATIEERMRGLGLLETKPAHPFLPESGKMSTQFGRAMVEDDHVPFLHRGVPTLHIIPSPFPTAVWHRIEDDGEHLDMPTVRDWAKIVTAFAMEWLDISEVEPKAGKAKREFHGRKPYIALNV